MGIRFSLIPNNPLKREAFEWTHSGFVAIGRMIGMARIRTQCQISSSTRAHPIHHEIIVVPVAEDGREMLFQHGTINPGFRGRSSHSVAHDAHRHFQTIAKHLSHIVGHGRAISHNFGSSCVPGLGSKQTKGVDFGKCSTVPSHIVGFPSRMHIENAESVVVAVRKCLLCGGRLFQWESHIRLSTAQPHFPHGHIVEAFHLTTSSNGEDSTLHWLRKHRPDAPFSAIVGHGFAEQLIVIAHHHVGTGIGKAVNVASTAL